MFCFGTSPPTSQRRSHFCIGVNKSLRFLDLLKSEIHSAIRDAVLSPSPACPISLSRPQLVEQLVFGFKNKTKTNTLSLCVPGRAELSKRWLCLCFGGDSSIKKFYVRQKSIVHSQLHLIIKKRFSDSVTQNDRQLPRLKQSHNCDLQKTQCATQNKGTKWSGACETRCGESWDLRVGKINFQKAASPHARRTGTNLRFTKSWYERAWTVEFANSS